MSAPEWTCEVALDLADKKEPRELVHHAVALAIERVGPMIHGGFRVVTVDTAMEGETVVKLRLGVSRN